MVFICFFRHLNGDKMNQYYIFLNFLDNLLAQLVQIWSITLLVGNFAAVLAIAAGFIMWGTNYDSHGGKKMIIGGIILLIAMIYLTQYPPDAVKMYYNSTAP